MLQGDDHAAAAPPADFAAKFSSLAEDMPRLRRDTYLQAGGQVSSPPVLPVDFFNVLNLSMHMSTHQLTVHDCACLQCRMQSHRQLGLPRSQKRPPLTPCFPCSYLIRILQEASLIRHSCRAAVSFFVYNSNCMSDGYPSWQLQEVEEPPAMPRQSPAAAPAPIIASAPVPQAAQHIPSSVGRYWSLHHSTRFCEHECLL